MRDRSDLRSVISAGNQIAEMGYKTKGRNSKEVLDEAERIVFEIAEKRNNANEGPQRIDDILLKTLARMDTLSKNRHNGGVTGVSTGFVDLNKNRRVTAFGFNHCGSPSFNGENYFCNELM